MNFVTLLSNDIEKIEKGRRGGVWGRVVTPIHTPPPYAAVPMLIMYTLKLSPNHGHLKIKSKSPN